MKKYSDRKSGIIDLIIFHDITIKSDAELNTELKFLDWFRTSNFKASAHYFILRSGEIIQMIDEKYASWNAGASLHKGRIGLNDTSIGIEIFYHPEEKAGYTEAQYKAATKLVDELLTRYDIEYEDIVDHKQVRNAYIAANCIDKNGKYYRKFDNKHIEIKTDMHLDFAKFKQYYILPLYDIEKGCEELF